MQNDLNAPISFTTRHERLLDDHTRILDDHSHKLESLSAKFDGLSARFDAQFRKTDEELHRIGLLMEENRKDTRLMLDVVLSNQKRHESVETLEGIVADHEIRISALEHQIREQ